MPPKKRTSSGSKKSANQNRQQQPQQPSQHCKFGIQHFFERHTQNAVTQNPKRPLNPPPISNPANLGENDSSHIEEGAQKPRILMGSVESHHGSAENSRNLINLHGLRGEMERDGGNLRVAEANLQGNGLSNQSQNTPIQNLLPVVVDAEEDQLLLVIDADENHRDNEVSPEVSKSVSVKRFKFSPGMLIKQTQDDGGDEVSWRISPVNERLHCMTKHLPEMRKALSDSSRFNHLNFQQCSKKKTSPDASVKLGKWLSSPPQEASEKCCGDLNKVGLSKDCSVGYCESNREAKSRALYDVSNCQSPFATPPSLSFFHEKPINFNDPDRASDQLSSRHHKKALIELLDQVENVISVEESVCKNLDACLSDSRTIRSYPSVEKLSVNAEGKIRKETLNFSFLVLEVSEKQGIVGSSGSPSSLKIIRLLNEQSGEERSVHLMDEWFYSVVAPGDTVHVIGEFDGEGKCDISREKNFLIVHPDILVSGTRVAGSFSCPRRAILDERLKCNEHATAALIGTLLHQIFQAGLAKDSLSKEVMEEYTRVVLQKNLESIYACGANENDIHKTLIGAIPKILNWISLFRDSQGSRVQGVDFGCNEGLKNLKISEVVDIEEMAWAPKYGLKGMIDASLRVKTESSNHGTIEKIMPLEFKTGKRTSGQTAMEHSAQVMLYTLLMSERYQKIIDCGILYYLQTDQTQGISVRRSDLIGLIMRRNELANDLLKALRTQQLPPMLQSANICRGCRHLNVCSIYHKAHGGTTEGSGLGDMFDSQVHHVTNAHATFLRKWDRLIDLEANELEIVKKEIWSLSSLRNDRHLAFLSSLKLDASEKHTKKDFCTGNRFVYRFVHPNTAGQNKVSLTTSSSLIDNLGCMLRIGDYVILSTEPDRLLVANGVIMDISGSHVMVSFPKRLRLPGSSPASIVHDLQQQAWRIDKDESMTTFAVMRFNLTQLFLQNEQSSHLRKMIVDLEVPRFDSGCALSQDPAISYIWSEKSLNDDQRRAIFKILTARDYALILGMPGTGKTSTMVHAVKALLIRGASVLLTSYTNTAVDNLLIKLKAQGIDFIRIGRYEAVHEDVRGNCLSAMDVHSIEDIKQRMDQAKVVAVTCLGITSPLLTNKGFDVCIMDEAGQTTLPVSLGPLMFASKFVLVGDHYQLPPLVQSAEAKENGMAVSLFCRLSEAHPQAISALRSQYRMCDGIMELSNALIYDNRLRCGSSEIANAKLQYKYVASAASWLREVLNPDRPVVFINTDMLPAYETNDRKAINNPTEASIIAEITNSLVRRGILEEDIGIITPYNSQATLIRQDVSKSVEIHTIDKYQGRDKDCILVSFVRSSENLKNCISSLLGDWHRINVAITRAKKKLIMVGSCRTLSRVPLLKLLIEKVEEKSFILSISEKDFHQKFELKRCSQIR